MPAERNAFRLGLTMLGFFGMLLGVLYFLAPSGGGDLTLKVRFPHNEFGTVLKSGGEVSCGGKTVGGVRSIDLQEMEHPETGVTTLYVVATFTIDSRLGLRKDCEVYPEGLLLGGVGKLVIGDRGVGEPIDPAAIIEGVSGPGIADLTRMLADQLDPRDPTSLLAMIKLQLDAADPKSLLGKIHESLDDVNRVTQSINNEFDVRYKDALLAKLHAIMDHVNDMTRLLRNEMDSSADRAMIGKLHKTFDTLESGLETVVALLEENREPISETVSHIHGTSEILETQIATAIAQQLDPTNAASIIAKTHIAIDRLGSSLTDIQAITAAGREVVVLNKQQLSDMIGNFKETSEHLKGASKDIRRSPWRLFYQPTIEEAAQANIFDAARAFSEAATQLDDAVGRLQVIAESRDGSVAVNQETLTDIRDELKRTFGNFTKAEAALWDQLKIK